ncbi:MAG: ATP-binding cassette domain-containing protein [Planctomycetes bacterium]|nr:ATP-binding cassette domain-containing protein [Planctomycetota bacterium]
MVRPPPAAARARTRVVVIAFDDVHKHFHDPDGREIVAVRGLDLVVRTGETHCLIGTSGCGKTTTLRMVNRLDTPSRGRILVGGQNVADADVFELRRNIGYVIQSGGLFPHLTVAENVGIMCALEGWPRARIDARVSELLDLVALQPSEFGARLPSELSGGQQQRVGVARALALDPDYVLMDEPFGALDPITRTQLHAEFGGLLEQVHKTVLLVTHDLGEAFSLGDRVTLMHRGELVQTGTRDDLVSNPATPFVSEFLASFDGGTLDDASR